MGCSARPGQVELGLGGGLCDECKKCAHPRHGRHPKVKVVLQPQFRAHSAVHFLGAPRGSTSNPATFSRPLQKTQLNFFNNTPHEPTCTTIINSSALHNCNNHKHPILAVAGLRIVTIFAKSAFHGTTVPFRACNQCLIWFSLLL